VKKIIVLLALVLAGCTDEPRARKALLDAGYKPTSVGGYGLFSCGDDLFSTEFTAIGPTGRPVRGTVCTGVFKNSTLRTE
jgi:hypothetical protein